jgi:hypothetical protein
MESERMIVQSCLKTEEGIIVPVFSASLRIDKKEVSCKAIEIGILLSIGEIEIPIPEAMIEHVTAHRKVVIYFLDGKRYFVEPASRLEIAQELLLEAKGVYKHFKNNQG